MPSCGAELPTLQLLRSTSEYLSISTRRISEFKKKKQSRKPILICSIQAWTTIRTKEPHLSICQTPSISTQAFTVQVRESCFYKKEILIRKSLGNFSWLLPSATTPVQTETRERRASLRQQHAKPTRACSKMRKLNCILRTVLITSSCIERGKWSLLWLMGSKNASKRSSRDAF